MKKLLAVLGLCIILSGCSTKRFALEGNPTIPQSEGTYHFVFWGIGQERTINPNEVCDYGVAAVQTNISFWNGFASVFTWGIYSPESYAIYCKKRTI